MAAELVPFGVLLRRWRERRRLTQGELALSADSSTRHLSYLETGRAHPSREIVLRLAEHLEIPLRDQNLLLLAAGFAPVFEERPLAELDAARQAIEQVLAAHHPYPAFAVDRHWNIVLSNGALPPLYEDCAPELMAKPVNAIRLILHPRGLGPRVLNFLEWRAHSVAVLRQQNEVRADPVIRGLLAEIAAYPAPAGGEAMPVSWEDARRYATPLRIATRLGPVSFLNTTTIFGTPTDVTLSELALETLFPADKQTVEIARKMTEEAGAGAAIRLVR